jgi:two-component system KDP operon response regulator KdpE
MSSTTVLIVDDEAPIRRAVRHALESDDVRVLESATAREAIDRAAAERPDLIVLDLGLPDADGRDVLSAVRGWSATPVLILSARHNDAEKVALLDAGADDYLVKPFSSAELQARVRALLRRGRVGAGGAGEPIVSADGLTLDLVRPGAWRNEKEIHLTRTEWDLIRAFMKHVGRTLTHEQLFRAVWGAASNDPQQLLRTHVRSLRRKLETDAMRPVIIVTEPGVGYRFQLDTK